MSNIEEDMKYFILEIDILINNIINMPEYTATGIVAVRQPLITKIYSLLNNYKRLEVRIKELEEENHLQRKQIMSAYDKGWIPVKKVKDKIERHKFAKKDFEKEYDSKNYKDDGLRARDFYMIVAEDLIIKALEEILEDK